MMIVHFINEKTFGFVFSYLHRRHLVKYKRNTSNKLFYIIK